MSQNLPLARRTEVFTLFLFLLYNKVEERAVGRRQPAAASAQLGKKGRFFSQEKNPFQQSVLIMDETGQDYIQLMSEKCWHTKKWMTNEVWLLHKKSGHLVRVSHLGL